MNFYRSEGTAWKLLVCRRSDFGLYFDTPPCWFHRLMQRLVFGIRWVRQ